MCRFTLITTLSLTLASLMISGCKNNSDDDSAVKNLKTATINISNVPFKLEVADNEQDRVMGLMYRSKLGRNEGMLFIFDYPQALTFHMNNCNIDLDGIFLDRNFRVLNVERMLYPRSGRSQYYRSSGPAQYVIELPLGTAARIDLKKGDKINISSIIDKTN